jgi:hypothetical protein
MAFRGVGTMAGDRRDRDGFGQCPGSEQLHAERRRGAALTSSLIPPLGKAGAETWRL